MLSVWISRLTRQDVHHAASARWLGSHVAASGDIVVPSLLLAEAAGGIARRTGDTTLGNQAVTDLLNLPAVYVITLDRPLAMRAAQLAANLRLRGADAVYVAVADYLSVPLFTWDREQLTRTVGWITARTP
ncbi:MAG: PIN domain-containing protein [Chloroflexota bacterium]|nr:PIN domain-containing protein [Chloroflexota bacterium]